MFRLAWIHLSFRGVRIWRRINNRHGEMIICKYYRTGRSIRESFDVREKCDLKNEKARMKVCNANRVQANEFVREHERTENCGNVACLRVPPRTTRPIATCDRLVKRWECRTKRSVYSLIKKKMFLPRNIRFSRDCYREQCASADFSYTTRNGWLKPD